MNAFAEHEDESLEENLNIASFFFVCEFFFFGRIQRKRIGTSYDMNKETPTFMSVDYRDRPKGIFWQKSKSFSQRLFWCLSVATPYMCTRNESSNESCLLCHIRLEFIQAMFFSNSCRVV